MLRYIVLLCLVLMAPGVWAQDQTPSVGVLPFVVHSPEDVAKTQTSVQETLIQRLNAEGVKTADLQSVRSAVRSGEAVQSEEQARAVGRKLQVGYVLTGSFNQIGNSISIDAKLIDVSGRKKTEPLLAEEKGMENLAAAANTIVQQMAVHLMAKALIGEVQVKGRDRIEAEAIKAVVKSKKGELLKPEQVSEDIKAIYKMGFFEKVDAEVSDGPSGKILTFVVQENPTVQEVKITGNKKIKEKDILAAISTRAFTVLQRNIVSDDVQKILKLYQQKGYFNATVTSSIDFPKDPRKAVVTFKIDENSKVFIKKITFTGNKNFSARKLRGVMQTKQKGLLSWITDQGILQKDILDTDVDRITVFYHDKGYMDAKVGTPVVTKKDDGFYIDIPISEGERYKVSSVKMSGDLFDNNDQIKKKLQTEEKEYFSREKLRKDIDTISKAYMDEGYAHTEVNPSVKRDQQNQTTDITYQVSRGEVYHIGRITISGNTKTRDNVIRREMKLSEGDTFSATKLEKSIAALKRLDYFEDVEITPSAGDQPGVMDLQVKVKEKLTGSISVGGGFSSDDGLFASGQIQQRNLFGRGQTVALKAYLGQDASRYIASFTEPWLFDHRLSAGIDLYDWVREYSSFDKEAVGMKLRTAYPFGNYSRLTAFYTLENANVTNVDENASAYVKDQEGKFLKSSITLGAERDTTDHPFLPTKGTINSVSMEVSSQYLGSDSDFLKYEMHSGVYIPLFWKFIGFARGEVGWIKELDSDNPTPIYERFFLGGINSLRAFDWGDVGPKDENGDIIGGLKYGLVNFELLFPIIEKLAMRGVFFFDAGNAFLGDENFDVSQFRTDAGAGIRWNSPMGPLRIEWGYNLDPKEGEDKYKWQFSAGAFF